MERKDLKDIAKDVRTRLAKEFPSCKFSVTLERYSMGQSLTVALMSAPFEVFASNMDVNNNIRTRDYAQLNEYQLRQDTEQYICNGEFLTPQAWNVLKRVDQVASAENWDNSDSQTDYFDVNYYLHLEVGKWNKPFVCTALAVAA